MIIVIIIVIKIVIVKVFFILIAVYKAILQDKERHVYSHFT